MKYLLYITILTVIVGCTSKKTSSEEKKTHSYIFISNESIKIEKIKVKKVMGGEILRSVEFQGNIINNRDKFTKVVALVSGIVLKVYKHIGEKIIKGEPLFAIKSREIGQNMLAYKSALQKSSFAWKKLKIEKDAYEKNISSKISYIKAQNVFQSANNEKNIAYHKLKILDLSDKVIKSSDYKNINRYTIKSPISGILTKKYSSIGEMVKSSQIVAVVENLDNVWIDIKVPPEYLNEIKVGDSLKVYSNRIKKSINSKIIYISPTVDVATRSATVRAQLKNNGLWRPGLCSSVEIIIKRKKAKIIVPLNAIISIGGKHVVFVQVAPNKFKVRYILLGESDDENIEVTNGLKKGEEVAVNGVLSLKGKWLTEMGD